MRVLSSATDERQVRVGARSVSLVIGVALTVTLTVLFAPKLLAIGRGSCLEAARARRFDGWNGCGPRLGTHHQDGTGRETYGELGDGADQHAGECSAPVSTDDDEIGLEIGC